MSEQSADASLRARRRKSVIRANVGYFVFCVAWLAMLSIVARTAMSRSSISSDFIVSGGVTLLTVSALYCLIGILQTRRAKVLARRFPNALVLPIARPGNLNRNLRNSGYHGKKIGLYFTLVVQPEHVEFWSKASDTDPRVQIDTKSIASVNAAPADMGMNASVPAIYLAVDAPQGGGEADRPPGETWIPLNPAHTGWGGGFPIYSVERVVQLAESVRSYLQTATGRELPLVGWYEWRS